MDVEKVKQAVIYFYVNITYSENPIYYYELGLGSSPPSLPCLSYTPLLCHPVFVMCLSCCFLKAQLFDTHMLFSCLK